MNPQRQVDEEGVLRTLLLAFALVLPMASMAYLKIQHVRLSYELSALHGRIRQEEELRRALLLARSRHLRGEEIQAFADHAGMLPRRQGFFIPGAFTREDQRQAGLRQPVD